MSAPTHTRLAIGLVTLAAVLALAPAGCRPAAPAGHEELGPERRVALARLEVENRTGTALDIAFRYAVEAGGEIGVGRAAPGQRTVMAPVPAAEPILLVARAPGFERHEGPRTLGMDQVWVWVIELDPTGG